MLGFCVGHLKLTGIILYLSRAKDAVQDSSGREKKTSIKQKPDPPYVGEVLQNPTIVFDGQILMDLFIEEQHVSESRHEHGRSHQVRAAERL